MMVTNTSLVKACLLDDLPIELGFVLGRSNRNPFIDVYLSQITPAFSMLANSSTGEEDKIVSCKY